jgi:hypothetical protein
MGGYSDLHTHLFGGSEPATVADEPPVSATGRWYVAHPARDAGQRPDRRRLRSGGSTTVCHASADAGKPGGSSHPDWRCSLRRDVQGPAAHPPRWPLPGAKLRRIGISVEPMNQESPREPRRVGIMATSLDAAPTELTPAMGWRGRYKDIAPTELGAAWVLGRHRAGGTTAKSYQPTPGLALGDVRTTLARRSCTALARAV